MKILSVQPAARRGGPSIQHLNFAKKSIEMGFEHHACIRSDHEMIDEYNETFSSVTTFKPVNAIIPRSLSPIKLLSYRGLVNEISNTLQDAAERVNADAIWTVNDAFIAGPIAAKRTGIPALTHFLGMTSYRPKPVGLGLIAFHKKYSNRLATCQDLIANDLVGLGYPRDRLDVVYNGIDIERFSTKPASDNQDELTIGMVANLDRRKGLMLFIESAIVVSKSIPGVKFHIAGDLEGDPDYLNEIKLRIADAGMKNNIVLDGIVTSMVEWYQKLDICCVPSLIEALSVACLEAMASSLPIVATDVGGNYIAVNHRKNGLLTKPNDPISLAQSIVELCESPGLRQNMGAEGRAIAKSTFSLEEVVGELNQAFSKL